MDMQVNINNGDRFEVELETWTDQGETLCHIENLKAVVFGGIPGERAVIEVLRVKKEYIAAKVHDKKRKQYYGFRKVYFRSVM